MLMLNCVPTAPIFIVSAFKGTPVDSDLENVGNGRSNLMFDTAIH